MRSSTFIFLVCASLACATEEPEPSVVDAGELVNENEDASIQALDAGLAAFDAGGLDAGVSLDASMVDSGMVDIPGGGFIGSPCDEDSDCDYENAICATDNINQGLCTLACERFCPDRENFPVTFCVEPAEIAPGFTTLPDQGACVSRCNFELFPGNGCREGFGCVQTARYNEPETENYACLPNVETQLDDCYAQLTQLGIDFEPTSIPDRSPSSHPNLVCHVEQPVVILSPMHDIELAYYDGRTTPRVKASCAMAKALSATLLDVKPFGVTRLLHIGTYNCRVISGTNRLSRHSMGDAIDIYGFEFADGSVATLVDDWEHDTTAPNSMAAQFLYNAAYRWHDAKLWTIILTPNYNAGHDNHFHVDLTPGSDFIQFQGTHFIGPAPYAD